jgi:hypothetical protein
VPEARQHTEHERGICMPADLRMGEAQEALGERRRQVHRDHWR